MLQDFTCIFCFFFWQNMLQDCTCIFVFPFGKTCYRIAPVIFVFSFGKTCYRIAPVFFVFSFGKTCYRIAPVFFCFFFWQNMLKDCTCIFCFFFWQNMLQDCTCIFLFSFFKVKQTTALHLCGARCWWRSWLRHCTTCRKVAGFISDYVTGIFHWYNPSGRTMALGLTQPLTEMSTRNISWGGKCGRCVGLTTLPPPNVLKSGSLNILEPSGPLQACNGIALPLRYKIKGTYIGKRG